MIIIPDDIVFHVLQFLDLKFLVLVASRVSHQFYEQSLKIPFGLNLKGKVLPEELILKIFPSEPNNIRDDDHRYYNITSLDLNHCMLRAEHFKQISASPRSRNLRNLDATLNTLLEEGAKAIGESQYFRNSLLETLKLGFCSIGNEGLKYLMHSNFRNLTSLDLTKNDLDNEALEMIATSPYMNKLKFLTLKRNLFDGNGVEKLVYGANLHNLTFLDLSMNEIYDTAFLKAIASSDNMKNLQILKLQHMHINTSTGLQYLADSSNLQNFTELDLAFNSLQILSLNSNSKIFMNLRTLILDFNQLGKDSMVTITNFCNLTKLSVDSNYFRDDAIEYLASSPNMKHLTWLKLANNSLGYESVKHIFNSKYLGNMEHLDLTNNSDLTDEISQLLQPSTILSLQHLKTLVLAELCLTGSDISEEAVSALSQSKTLHNIRMVNLKFTLVSRETIQQVESSCGILFVVDKR
ncbi:hypothetical protein C9374_002166 [Naegleria lovaniensis]|uniref:F-box domain-containing protein n=1 Tax=Naegleria lovaniensis TaxID=51637 RepID=A0AA88KN31_NAELO|nr:uncharacterized protein C9374_002166 [Naegleria lovaniensis]KAG2387131.1 hypothetical protein C9374_002166 [Naegleria lovaniensis]